MNEEATILERQIQAAPSAPGCYIFKDARGKVLYVGKAVDLRKRVPAYLRPGADGRPHIPFLMEKAESVEFIVVNHEKEALILENNLIKRFRPRYNIVLATDDKTFVSVRMDMRHDFPRATIVHKYKLDGASYFGPYNSAGKLYKTLEVLRRFFPLRLCSDHVLANRTRPCVYHEIGVCCAPCVPGKVTKDQYTAIVRDFTRALEGKDDRVARDLEQRMHEASGALDFEKAAALRDKLLAVQETTLRQRAQIGTDKTAHRDVHGLYRQADRACIATLMYRDGRLEDSATREFQTLLPDEEVLRGFLMQYYERASFVPDEVIVPLELEGMAALGEWISDRAERKVQVIYPQRGDRAKLLQMADVNARHALKVRAEIEQRSRQTLRELQEALGLERTPVRIECYDISHGGGKDTVGSGVCFIDGEPSKANYRHYKVKSHDRNDDFASMEEVLRRRMKRALEDGVVPDLVVIDGGAGQLGRVQEVFDELNIIGIDLVALAKARDRKRPGWETAWQETPEQKPERVFVPGRDEPLVLPAHSPALHLLMRVRDEAHRFAITFHRKQKRKSNLGSSLDDIPGVGPKKKRALIKRFGSPKGVKLASLDELRAVEGINEKLAAAIFEAFAAEREKLKP
ncbi:MAG: excinuclease ABC subunit UvrC [Planctomycetes bacterium]|nr:excinuclease ABC subunit UvrC [Planctomycetota bacterium]MCW8134556.1 excinuclease ABC subunit UvrC [Planctomycetota bacterium]